MIDITAWITSTWGTVFTVALLVTMSATVVIALRQAKILQLSEETQCLPPQPT